MKPIYFPMLGSGWGPNAPAGTLRPDSGGPIWRDMRNLRFHDGYAARRATLAEFDAGTIYPSIPWNGRDTFYTGQVPVVILTDYQAAPNDDVASMVVVTDRELWLYRTSSWTNLTPTYTTGTVSATNGSTAVSGTGTQWTTLGIHQGNLVEIPAGSGDWFPVSSVGSNTSITLGSAFTGSTASGLSYVIRRTFPDIGKNAPFFAEVFNGDLYVAGPLVQNGQPAVVRVTGAFGFPVPSPATYLTAAFDVTGGIDVYAGAGSSDALVGMAVLDDGRVVAGLVSNSYGARILYSSHLNQAVWTTAPGGFTDVTTISGTLRALQRYGTSLTLHYDTGIAWGEPTGQDDPPLSFRPTRARKGCFAPRTLTSSPGGGLVYLGSDMNVYRFRGGGEERVGSVKSGSDPSPPRDTLSQFRKNAVYLMAHASVDEYRGDWRLLMPQKSDSAADRDDLHSSQETETLEFVWNETTGQWSQGKYGIWVGAVSNRMLSQPFSSWRSGGMRSEGFAIVGVPSYDPNGATGSGGASSNMVYRLIENGSADVDPGFSQGSEGTFYLESDDLYLAPEEMIVASHVLLWMSGSSDVSETVVIEVSSDGGSSWVEADSMSAAPALVDNRERCYPYAIEGIAAGTTVRMRISLPESGTSKSRLHRALLRVESLGSVVASPEAWG